MCHLPPSLQVRVGVFSHFNRDRLHSDYQLQSQVLHVGVSLMASAVRGPEGEGYAWGAAGGSVSSSNGTLLWEEGPASDWKVTGSNPVSHFLWALVQGS